MHPLNVVVTGGAGFIGSHLCERLLAGGHRVVAVDSFDTFYDPAIKRRNLQVALLDERFTLIAADIRDSAALGRGIEHSGVAQVDVVVHLAARAGVRPSLAVPQLYADVNVAGTASILELTRSMGATRFVFGSSSSVYGDSARVPFAEDDPASSPISPYAATKRSGELLARTYAHLYGFSVVCLRFFTVYGPRQRPDLAIHKFARLLAEGSPIPLFGDGSSQRDYTYVDDILQGVEGAIEYTGMHRGAFEIINLGESRTTTLSRLVDLLASELEVTPSFERHPAQPGDVDRTYADISKAVRLLGYAPSTPVEAGIPRFVEWFRQQSPSAPSGR